MVQFAESPQCRMAALIQHFGDTDDGLRPCGHCDFCSPQSATAQTFRQPTTEEERQLRAILRALDGQTRATGKLHTELSTSSLRNTPAADRKVFDTLLDALTRAGLITLITDQWTNPEGNVVTYKKASLTHEGRTLTGPLPPDLLLKDAGQATATSRKKSKSSNTTKPSKASLKAERDQTTAAYTPTQKSLEANLREWRKTEAAKTGKPAFIVFGDSVLHNFSPRSPKDHLRTPHSLRHRPGKSRSLWRPPHRPLPRRSRQPKRRHRFFQPSQHPTFTPHCFRSSHKQRILNSKSRDPTTLKRIVISTEP